MQPGLEDSARKNSIGRLPGSLRQKLSDRGRAVAGDVCPRRFLLPVWSWQGTSPKESPICLLCLNRCGSSRKAATASAVLGPRRESTQAADGRVALEESGQFLFHLPDLPCQRLQFAHKDIAAEGLP